MPQTAPQRRFGHYETDPGTAHSLPADHPAVRKGRTIFPSTVIDPEAAPRLLVSGINQRKIGSRVTKGTWAGMPIFCLTLEERATCPASCFHWRSCYGNGMHMARRHEHGPKLEYLLPLELADMQARFPAGFVIRLHILGDFYDAAYVMLWARWLQAFPALHVFGYTARPQNGGIGRTIDRMNRAAPERCAIRFSVPKISARGLRGDQIEATTVWEMPETAQAAGAIVCPAQTGRTDCCGTCGLCWTTRKPIAFIAHGNPHPGRPKKGASDA